MPGKSISGSVGLGGTNIMADVMTVQFLLNCVPAGQGGPNVELVVDGLMGPKTSQAIQRFQKALFGWSDGRVDPELKGGKTFPALKAFDPAPNSPPISPQNPPKGAKYPGGKAWGSKSGEFPGGKSGGGKSGQPPSSKTGLPGIKMPGPPGKGWPPGSKGG